VDGFVSPTLPRRSHERANPWVTCGSPCLGHVAPLHLLNLMPLVTHPLDYLSVELSTTVPAIRLPCHLYGLYGSVTSFVWTCHMSPLQGWHVSLPDWSHVPVHVTRSYAQSPCHVSPPKDATSALTLPCHVNCMITDLYNQLPRGTVRAVQSSFCRLFGKTNTS
jgi:hypothetical protein